MNYTLYGSKEHLKKEKNRYDYISSGKWYDFFCTWHSFGTYNYYTGYNNNGKPIPPPMTITMKGVNFNFVTDKHMYLGTPAIEPPLEVIEWCLRNCKHKFRIKFMYDEEYFPILILWFKNKNEAMHAKLTFDK